MDFAHWADAFVIAMQPINILYIVLGSLFGLIVGALPGLGSIFGITLMLPFTYYMEPATAIIFLASIHAAVMFGDTWAAVLINTPGSVGSIATSWDGYPLATQGRSGYALGLAATASLSGGLIGWVWLILLSPMLIKMALAMGPPEYTMLGLLALSFLSLTAGGQAIKGLILGGLGLMVTFVGSDSITATSRFTFGSLYLEDGFPIVVIALGLFAFSESMVMAEKGGQIAKIQKMSSQLKEGMLDTLRHPMTILRGSTVGAVLGAMPGVGLSTAAIVSYFVEKRASKDGDKFGTGHPMGVTAPETANNASAVTSLAPTFTLGIPGSPTAAILMAALLIHGVTFGPRMFAKGGIGYTVFVGILLAQFAFFIIGIIINRWMVKIVLVPFSLLVPGIIMMTFIGAYAGRHRITDIVMMMGFGVLGYVLKRFGWPPACLVLGAVLGTMIESSFARTMRISGGDYSVFFTRPVSLGLFIVTILFLLSPYLSGWYRKLAGKRSKNSSAA